MCILGQHNSRDTVEGSPKAQLGLTGYPLSGWAFSASTGWVFSASTGQPATYPASQTASSEFPRVSIAHRRL